MRKLRAGDAVNASLNFCLHSTEIKSLAEGVEVGGGEEGEDFNGLDGPSDRWFLGEPSGLNTAPLRLLDSRELDDCSAKGGTVRVECR